MMMLRKIVLAGCADDVRTQFQTALNQAATVLHLAMDDPLAHETFSDADVIVLDARAGVDLLHRLARSFDTAAAAASVFILGEDQVTDAIREVIPHARPLPEPIDFGYFRGALETTRHDRERITSLSKEQDRVRALYQVSNALLKITGREQAAQALGSVLPRLLDASMIMLCFPGSAPADFFFYAPSGIDAPTGKALQARLAHEWNEACPGEAADWAWLEEIVGRHAGQGVTAISSDSFVNTRIVRDGDSPGFLTMVPRQKRMPDEMFLQTFLVIADMISVSLNNIVLKERLEERATRDGLTGLLNRQTLMDELEKECRRSQRYLAPVSLIMMDLDHFKAVNDTHGHQVGDEALRASAGLIQSSIREMDLAGRCGGEEFIIVLPNTDSDGANVWAERLRLAMENSPIAVKDKFVPITASFGISTGVGPTAETDALIGRADKALYAAKTGGRNKVIVHRSFGGDTPITRRDPVAR
ncbi:hypothetical protein BH09SUM1_BH09SUM1_01470 [soil metagenome]